MWATEALSEKKINSIVLSQQASIYWDKYNESLKENGLPPSITHSANEAKRLTQHLYMKQTHDGKVIAGGDRLVSLSFEVPNTPIREEWNQTAKSFAEKMFPFLKTH